MNTDELVQFDALELEIPEDNPDRTKYHSVALRQRQISPSDVGQIKLMSPVDIIFSFILTACITVVITDACMVLGRRMREHKHRPAKDIATRSSTTL